MRISLMSSLAAGLVLAASSVLADPAPVAPPTAATAPAGVANPAAPAAAAAPTKAKKVPDDIICETFDDVGSHIHKTRVCMTRAERDNRQKQGQDDMNNIMDHTRMLTPSPASSGGLH